MHKEAVIKNLFVVGFGVYTLIALLYALFALKPQGLLWQNVSGFRFYFLASAVILTFVAVFLTKKIEQADRRHLRWMVVLSCIIAALISFGLLSHLHSVAFSDDFIQRETAKYFAYNPGTVLTREMSDFWYFEYYGNVYFFTIVLVAVYRILNLLHISNPEIVLVCLNAALVWAGVALMALTIKNARGDKAAVRFWVVSVCNPVFYWLMFWVYSNSVSIFLISLLIYLETKFDTAVQLKSRIFLGVGIGLVATVGFYIRAVVVFPLIAYAMYLMYQVWKKRGAWKNWVLLVLVFLMVWMPVSTGIKQINHHYFAAGEEGNFPMWHWLMIGSHNGGKFTLDDKDFSASFASAQEKKEAELERIRTYMQEQGTVGMLSLYAEKTGIVFGSGNAGVDSRLRRAEDTGFVYQHVSGTARDFYWLYASIYRIVILAGMLAFAISAFKNRKEDVLFSIILITMIGAFVFYTFWEAQETYSIPFLPMMIAAASFGMEGLSKQPLFEGKHVPKVKRAIILVYILICSSLFFAATVHEYAVKDLLWYTGWDRDELQVTDQEILQAFTARTSFDQIEVDVWDPVLQDEDMPVYKMELYNSANVCIRQTQVTVESVSNHKVVWSFDPVESQGEQFYLRIYRISGSASYIPFELHRLDTINSYTPVLVDGEKQNTYLKMVISNHVDAPLFGKTEYLLMCIGGGVVMTLIFSRKKNGYHDQT